MKKIERKFLVYKENIPYDLSKIPYQDIVQGYISSCENDLIFRLRNVLYRNSNNIPLGEEWFQNVKSKGTKVRDDYEIRLLREQFNILWGLCESKSINKYRYDLPLDRDNNILIECFRANLRGLWIVKIKFKTIEDCDNFKPLNWFDEEITEKLQYSSFELASGLPEEHCQKLKNRYEKTRN